jgi:polyisoprenoid-binding protein YceI
MMRNVLIGVAVVAAVLVALLAFTVFRPPEAASGPITAVPLATSAATTAPTAAATAAATTAPTAAATAEPTTAATSEPTAVATEAAPVAANQIFEIVPEESEARFLIDEVLRGADFTVVGTTGQVAGQIALDPNAPQSAQVGVIQVNARDLATDSEFRDRAIKNAILLTNEHEFVTFTPTSLEGLPDAVSVGQPFTFQINGDLSVAGTTRPVVFEVTVTPTSETEINGTAITTVLYADFGLNIPDSPAVDTVADEVRIEIDFIARAVA